MDYPLTMKKFGDFFKSYKTTYPFNSEQALEEFKSLIETNGYLKIHERFFFWFSGYVPIYLSNLNELMSGNCIIPETWRYFIAIMAVSTIRCEYLLRSLQETFLTKGGDENWLIYGVDFVPDKLKKLIKVNNMLAHQPWKITSIEINEIIGKHSWNRDEFVHASLIMINYHKLASIVECLRVKFLDSDEGNSNSHNASHKKHVKHMSIDLESKNKLYNNILEMNEEKEEGEKGNFKLEDVKIPTTEYLESNENNKIESPEFEKYISNYCTVYIDFDNYSENRMSSFVRIILIYFVEF